MRLGNSSLKGLLVRLTASIPLIEPSKVCGPRSPGRCAVGLAKDQAGILTSPFRIRKKDLVWLVPFAAATTYETIKLVCETEPRAPELLNPKVDHDLSTICLK